MSALLVDDLVATVPTRTRPGRWRHVERGPQARPQLVALPGGRPGGVGAPQVRGSVPEGIRVAAPAGSWRLTDRGIAVVVVFFLALVATAALVLVDGFLAVSNAPVEAPGAVLAAVQAAG